MKVRVIDHPDSLDSLRAAWEKLEAHAELPLQHFIWVQAYASVFAKSGELRVFVVENGAELAAAWPLIHRQGSTRLENLGMMGICVPSDALCSSSEALRPLADALANLRIPLLLNRIPAHSPLIHALRKSFRGRGILISRPDVSWPWITLDAGWAEPETRFNSKRRAYLRRARRIAEQLGTVTAEVLSPVPESLSPMLEEALAVEAAGWKGRSGTALAMDQAMGIFHRRYMAAACEKGILRICFLRIHGRAAAMQLGLEMGGRFWLMKIGYDEAFASCSPGNLLIRETVSYAAKRGLKSVAFMGALESWKEQWTREKNASVILRGYPAGLCGAAALAGDLAKFAWNKSGLFFTARS